MSNFKEHEDYTTLYGLATTLYAQGYKADPNYDPAKAAKLQQIFTKYHINERYEACQAIIDAWTDFSKLSTYEKSKAATVYTTEDTLEEELSEEMTNAIMQIADLTEDLLNGLIDRIEYYDLTDEVLNIYFKENTDEDEGS